ncbi:MULTISPECIES: aldo/keto reductase [Oceanobacillus]|uniref:Aldo/keto reductase n=1 Tax=Oceanobacillus aidingensis TaxID=645964 RepID=A0ABV9JVP6_9BACI|nr:aldo/keto reductase [Oceanobacillus oncorhynchi]MDM8101755.1 aldo/keto reductase [Oceanobacillus oncorhynchi]
MKKVEIAGREVLPIGLGTMNMGDKAGTFNQEVQAIRTGIDQGVQLIDTAEMYGSGNAEKLVGSAIKPYAREDLFLISKVLPSNASKKDLPVSLDNSLKRLETNYIDLYLLHWKEEVPLKETVEALEEARNQGKIKAWGVSNLDVDDLEHVIHLPGGDNCKANQVRYNVANRGIEFDLVPMMAQHNMPVIAYSPIDRGDSFGANLTKQQVLKDLAEKHEADVFQILLAWSIRNGRTIAIPQSSNPDHVVNNIKAAEMELTEQDLKQIDTVYPEPASKQRLALW